MKKSLIFIVLALCVVCMSSCGQSETQSTSSSLKKDVKRESISVLTSPEMIKNMTTSIEESGTGVSSEFPTTSIHRSEIIVTSSEIPITSEVQTESTVPMSTISEGVKEGTGGEFVYAYISKMAIPRIVPQEKFEQYVEWNKNIWKDKSLNIARGSVFDYIREFKISEESFREVNKKLLEPFSEEEVNDLYQLKKSEFNQKYADDYILVKNESMYNIRELMKLDENALKELEITKAEISAQLDKEYKNDPEMVEYYRNKFGY